ncbi:MAG: flagellar biosynthesis protein FlhB [Syntrophobacteraceae bacterium]|jgi:flagellar biosynthetic protein FlhB|nr:flagellar biosynthesis protein FlhB [Syntrophobacteraceae bacterium]
MASGQEKTEQPTSKKLSDARKRGQIPRSSELNASVVLLAGGAATYSFARVIPEQFRMLMEDLWGQGFHTAFESPLSGDMFLVVIRHFFLMIAPTLLACMTAAIAISIAQTKGISFSWETIQPKLSKVNPMSGFQRLVSFRSLLELLKSILKFIVIGATGYSVYSSEHEAVMSLMRGAPSLTLETLGTLSLRIVLRVGLIMLLLSFLDYYYQKWQHMRDLRMTKQEVKEEHKQSEGNPQIKGRIRSLQRSLARQRMMSSIPKASVVITNPTHFAVALRYDSQMEAPTVVARGVDFLARRIIKKARRHGVPVVRNPPLARALYHQVKLEEVIPANLYKAVAKVLAYIHQQRYRKPH